MKGGVMAYSAATIANYFLEKAKTEGAQLTQMQLHKLIYFAHGWHLGLYHKPLINERIRAWKYGPVIKSVYRAFKAFGSRPIQTFAPDCTDHPASSAIRELGQNTKNLLDRVWNVYGHRSAAELSGMTHAPTTPWSEAWQSCGGIRNVDIPDEAIERYFEGRAQHNRHAGTAAG